MPVVETLEPGSPLAERLAVVTFALTFYCLGTTYFEAFVNHRTWHLVGPREFPANHQALTPRVVAVMLFPTGVYALSLVALLVLHPASISRTAIATSLALVGIAIVSSALVQVPIQRQLGSTGVTAALPERLISTDLVWRKVPLGLNAVLRLAAFRSS